MQSFNDSRITHWDHEANAIQSAGMHRSPNAGAKSARFYLGTAVNSPCYVSEKESI